MEEILEEERIYDVKLKEELTDDEFKEKDKLITVSKFSKVFLIIMGILLVVSLILCFL